MKKLSVRKITMIAALSSLSIALSVVESYIPLGVPGAKLGLANLVTILTLYYFGFYIALFVSLLRVVVASLITGSILSMGFVMSFSGALASLLLMALLKKFAHCFTVVGVSIAGAFMHSLTQIGVAMIYYQSTAIAYYFPILSIISLLTGAIVGFLSEYTLNNDYLRRVVEGNEYEKEK